MVGKAVRLGTRISSPLFSPCAMCSRCTAAVQEEESTACFTPKYAAKFALERLAFRSEDVILRFNDLQDALIDLLRLMNARQRNLDHDIHSLFDARPIKNTAPVLRKQAGIVASRIRTA